MTLELVLPIRGHSIDDPPPMPIGHVDVALLKDGQQVASCNLMDGSLVLTYESPDRWCVRCEDTGDADAYEFVCLDPHGSPLAVEQGVIGDGVTA